MGFSARGLLVLVLWLTAACTKKEPPVYEGDQKRADLISNRPIGSTPELFVVTLDAPALLAAAVPTPGGITIPQGAKDAVLEEQAKFEQKLKAVAPQAQILYHYRLTLNGLAVFATPDIAPAMMALAGVHSVSPAQEMARPQAVLIEPAPPLSSSTNAVSFIGGDRARQLGLTGKGIRVGIIDTGVDYTHAMLGGSGRADDFKAVDPNLPNALFPNSKVTGGIDLVGTDFNASSPFTQGRLPKPDTNPIDEAGHGTHVAATVAGIGDGKKTYSGLASDAQIYAIKIFGKTGSTADAVVVAGFEYAADPNGDLNPADRLDVINLSLGGGFGQPQILYNEAARNLVRGGTFIVASAGNLGPTNYIVGAPGTADDALSVAASIDGSPHNWQFNAIRFTSADGSHFTVKSVEGPISKPIDEIASTEGSLVYIGFADKDLSNPEKAVINGKVALILRGKVSFADKIRRAMDGGAIGVVVMNNEAGDKAFAMGGEGHYEIPAVMIGNDTGVRLLRAIQQTEIRVQFKTSDKIFEPEQVDRITDFSSQGPRSEDNLFKPEIAAPGDAIISAKMGSGADSIKMSGTSMAAPNTSAAVAVLRQAQPTLSPLEIKSLLMDTAKVLSGPKGSIPFTLQGAGRIQIDKALDAKILLSPAALSLGRIQIGSPRKLVREITIRNISSAEVNLTVRTEASTGMSITAPPQVVIGAGAQTMLQVEINVAMNTHDGFIAEMNGQIQFVENDKILSHVPALAVGVQSALLRAQAPAADHVKILNSSPLEGTVLPFNLLGQDAAKPVGSPAEAWKSRTCDLMSAGYRIIRKANKEGAQTDYLQLGYKLHQPVTTWILCEVTALIDINGDGVADQELAGSRGSNLEGFAQTNFVTMLLDSTRARDLRLVYEAALSKGEAKATIDYSSALLDVSPMAPFPQSTIAVTEVPLSKIGKGADGKIHLKLATLSGGGESIEADDYLGSTLGDWLTIPVGMNEQAFQNLPELINLSGYGQAAIPLERGSGSEKLVLYYPNNEYFVNGADNQAEIY